MRKTIPFVRGTSSYGGVLPNRNFLLNLAVRDKTAKSDAERESIAKAEKIKAKNEYEKSYKSEHSYILGGIAITKESIALYIAGDETIPYKKLPLGYKVVTDIDEKLVRDDPEWRELAKHIYDKLAEQLTDSNYKGYNRHGQRRNPNSWNSLSRKRNLLTKDILARNRTATARLLFDV